MYFILVSSFSLVFFLKYQMKMNVPLQILAKPSSLPDAMSPEEFEATE